MDLLKDKLSGFPLMGIRIVFLFSVLVCFSCDTKNVDNKTTFNEPNTPGKEPLDPAQAENKANHAQKSPSDISAPVEGGAESYEYKIIPAEEDTFGYEILKNGKAIIRQVTIPGMPGIKAFSSKQDAEKVANLVMRKLQKGEMPPSVSSEELRRLKVTK